MQRSRSLAGMPAKPWAWLLGGLLLLSLGGLWYASASAAAQNCSDCTWLPVQTTAALTPGTAAAMDSPIFTYSPGWTVTAAGADPAEPADPFAVPAGTVSFTSPGGDLYLLLAPGNYWAYLYVTVDGRPANRLPVIPGNRDSGGRAAGYKPLLAPERILERPDQAAEAEPRWLLVHHADAGQAQNVLIELWRGWGQAPLRGIAVDLPPGARVEPNGPSLAQLSVQRWPAALLMLLGLWLLATAYIRFDIHAPTIPSEKTNPFHTYAGPTAVAGMLLVAAAIALNTWFLCPLGLALLALAGIVRPTLWVSALLFGLPFAYAVKLPVLPTRNFDLIDIGVWGGLLVVLLHLILPNLLPRPHVGVREHGRAWQNSLRTTPVLLALAALTTWALVAAIAALYPDLALREWRVVFLNALVFAAVLMLTLRLSPAPGADRWLLVAGWLAGAALVSLFGLWGYLAGNTWVTQAEGVRRIQAFYGSANNLALYLDRTLAVSLALVLFLRNSRHRLWWALLAVPQALAWLLTFSKGSLLLAGPAMALVLLIGGGWLLHKQGRSLRPLWILLAAGGLALLILTPFLGAERFQRLFDLGAGTGFLRLQLWRSALQMGLDHPLLGVGPDNFLYAYRSGYLLPSAWQEPNLNHPHNLLLDWWTRLGLPGLLLGLAWLGLGTLSVLRWLRRGPARPLALGVLAAIAAALAHGLIDVGYALPDLMIVWVLLFGLAPPPLSTPDPTKKPLPNTGSG